MDVNVSPVKDRDAARNSSALAGSLARTMAFTAKFAGSCTNSSTNLETTDRAFTVIGASATVAPFEFDTINRRLTLEKARPCISAHEGKNRAVLIGIAQ